jgi:PAS domain S-box-containing protein
MNDFSDIAKQTAFQNYVKGDSKEYIFRFALENSNIGVWEYDADLKQVFFSNESKKIIGFENDDNFGKNIDDWNNRVHPDDKEQYFQDFKDHLNGIKPLYENVHRVLCKDGTYKWIKDIGKITEWTKTGDPKRIIGTHNDITKPKWKEDALASSLSQIIEKNKQLKNFAHIVTHNLKSHSSNFENLLEFYNESDSEEEKAELIKHLETVSGSLSKTISNLNKIVSIQTNKDKSIEKINICKYVNNSISLLDVEIEKHKAKIINNIDGNLIIDFNPAYLESIFQNLLSNALKYKHPNREPIIEFNSTTNQNKIEISITDNGLGIDLDKYSNDMFNLYRTFHKNENAEGVGLYLVKNQLESFGATIFVKSKVNVGTTFTITFPFDAN